MANSNLNVGIKLKQSMAVSCTNVGRYNLPTMTVSNPNVGIIWMHIFIYGC